MGSSNKSESDKGKAKQEYGSIPDLSLSSPRGDGNNGNNPLQKFLGWGLKTAAVTAGAVAIGVVLKSTMMAMSSSSSGVPDMLSEPPRAKKDPKQVLFGHVEGENRGPNAMKPARVREDDYFWIRDDERKNEQVLTHLRKENAYTKYMTKHLDKARDELYKEMLSHIQETDQTVPYKQGDYMYSSRTVEGLSYDINIRKKIKETPGSVVSSKSFVVDEAEEITVDENELAKGLTHCEVRSLKPSPDHGLIAYSMDTVGYETYKIYIKDMAAGGALLPDVIEDTTGSIAWGIDRQVLFYATQDDAHRSFKIWMHRLGTPQSQDVLIYTEPDELYSAMFFKSKSSHYLFVGSGSTETSEWHYLDLAKIAQDPTSRPELHLIQARRKGVDYEVENWEDQFFIVTNQDEAKNFKLMHTPVATPSAEHWKDFIPYDASVRVSSVYCFKNFLVITGRQGGYTQIWTCDPRDASSRHMVDFEEKAHVVHSGMNMEYDTSLFRFSYSSMTTPRQQWDYNVTTKERTLLKETPVPNFERSLYKSDRFFAKSKDGVQIPMSVVYRKDKFKQGEPSPLFLYAYGSYEAPMDPGFNAMYLPLLDRGMTCVIAHVRGGGEEGRTWYDPGGRLLTKKNTFEDFIACADYLVDNGYTEPSKLAIEGRSAGGLTMGAVLNMRPDLFRVAIAGVPFVDVMNTMSDPSIPLTVGEWEEVGNPNEEKFYDYILSYSPYDNVQRVSYPSILATGGLYDPRVAYWEPAKWVAKLRDMNVGSHPVLLKLDLDVGHFSASDRYRYYRERAFDMSFMLDQLGLI